MFLIQEIIYPLLDIDVRTLIAVLFWGNGISVLLIYSFKLTNPYLQDKALSSYYILAKFSQALAHFLFFFRNLLPDMLSVNMGNTLLFMGFYWEAASMLTIIQGNTTRRLQCVGAITAISVFTFNLVEYLWPENPSLRVAVASVCVFVTLLLPTILLLCSKGVSRFKRIVGLFYVLFLAMLLPRAILATYTSFSILTNSTIQTLTFLSLILLMIFSLSAYLLLMKEGSDQKIMQLASVDALSGLANRQNFMHSATRVFERHKSDGMPLAILFLDIDNFKTINDTYGHEFGDRVIQAFADELRNRLRVGDLSCRYGGEEFLILLPQVDAEVASHVCNRIMEELTHLIVGGNPDFRFTVSCGICFGIPAEEDTLEGFIRRSDNAMYAAKRKGKNCIVLHGAEADPLCACTEPAMPPE